MALSRQCCFAATCHNAAQCLRPSPEPRSQVTSSSFLRASLAALTWYLACRAPAATMTQLGPRCASFLIACILAAAAAVPHAASAEHTRRKTGADARLLRHSRHKSRRLMQVRVTLRPDSAASILCSHVRKRYQCGPSETAAPVCKQMQPSWPLISLHSGPAARAIVVSDRAAGLVVCMRSF